MKRYAIESSDYQGVFYTGEQTENGTPVMINNIEKAKLYPTIEEAIRVRSGFKTDSNYDIREIEVILKLGYTVKE